jgi:peptidoglycan/xylan/chitin deacetylase (PgdA/CDA1 family)
MNYFVKTPSWLKKIYPRRLWSIDTKEKVIYLTFDDGPHPIATPFVLDELGKYNAKATFFCIGKNVLDRPLLYKQVLEAGHRIGNHTQHHLNGWNTNTDEYVADIAEATKHIDSDLFRPPYGRMRSSQAKSIAKAMNNESSKIVMWDILSGDFDISITNEKCLENAIRNCEPGSIVVFHDSEKAFPHLEYTLPRFLEFFAEKGWKFDGLP